MNVMPILYKPLHQAIQLVFGACMRVTVMIYDEKYFHVSLSKQELILPAPKASA